LYVHNIHSIGGSCSSIPEGDPFTADYLHWFSMEVGGLPEVFTGINENVISAAVEGTLVMAGPFVNLGALQAATAVSEADI
jgi:hypothetical protein